MAIRRLYTIIVPNHVKPSGGDVRHHGTLFVHNGTVAVHYYDTVKEAREAIKAFFPGPRHWEYRVALVAWDDEEPKDGD